MELKTDYKDDVLDTSVNNSRKYNMTSNSDGTVSFTDATSYSQVGDTLSSIDVNRITSAINSIVATSVTANQETVILPAGTSEPDASMIQQGKTCIYFQIVE